MDILIIDGNSKKSKMVLNLISEIYFTNDNTDNTICKPPAIDVFYVMIKDLNGNIIKGAYYNTKKPLEGQYIMVHENYSDKNKHPNHISGTVIKIY